MKSAMGPRVERFDGIISAVDRDSPADRAGILPGDKVITVNGARPRDVIDYQIFSDEPRISFQLERDGSELRIEFDNSVGRAGVAFAHTIFNEMKTCQNRCLFCFIDQLPADCRTSLHLKDDDFRLSFLYGNFITLTNMSRSDLERVVDQRLSPLYVSVHSVDPAVRRELIRPPKKDLALDNLKYLVEAGIEIHAQIVVCPGLNDRDDLSRTLTSLYQDYPGIASVGVVPVGTTKHRTGQHPIPSFTAGTMSAVLDEIELRRKRAVNERGYSWVYGADELYLASGRSLPPADLYDDFAQIENGIGLTRIFLDEIDTWLNERKGSINKAVAGASIVTGRLGASIFTSLHERMTEAGIELRVTEVVNGWLGPEVTVAALIAGEDIIAALGTSRTGQLVLIPATTLNADHLFLDGLTVAEVEERTGARIVAVPARGADLMEILVKGVDRCA